MALILESIVHAAQLHLNEIYAWAWICRHGIACFVPEYTSPGASSAKASINALQVYNSAIGSMARSEIQRAHCASRETESEVTTEQQSLRG